VSPIYLTSELYHWFIR